MELGYLNDSVYLTVRFQNPEIYELSENTYTKVSGSFVRICGLEQAEIALDRNSKDRPAARYNRKGQNALYLTVNEETARVAMKKYKNRTSSPLYLFSYNVEACSLVDLRHPENNRYRDLAASDWLEAVKNNSEPSSWEVADILRGNDEIGLIDPSRKNPDSWHVTLFRWNEKGAPMVSLINDPKPIEL